MESAISCASDVYENIDLDETEQNMKDIDALSEQIRIYTNKVETSEKNLEKRKQKCDAFKKQIIGSALLELDIYALDSLLNSMSDFSNNLDIGIHKLETVESDI